MISFSDCKKGNSFIDLILVLIIVVIIAIGSIFGHKMFDEINSDIQADADIGSDAKNVSQKLYDVYPSLMDGIFLFVFIMLILWNIIAVYVIDTRPIFFMISFLVLAAFFVVAALLGNTFDDIMTDDSISSYANQHTWTTWFMRHLLEISVVSGFTLLIVLFIKLRTG